MSNLKNLRRKIDGLDSKIVELLNKRAELGLEVKKLKEITKKGAFAPNREKEIYQRIRKLNKGPLTPDALKAVYREIMSGSLALGEPVRVAYLGPPATFTHLAALKKFGSQVEYIPTSSITDIFAEVEGERADYGVVPIENSIEGAVTHTLDMFMDSDLKVCSEILLEISHNLLANCKKDKIKKIYSNPQVFGQCRLWLEANLPRVDLVEVSSTTKASELASKEKNSAAIASFLAAQKYKLKIIARSIEDSTHNVTRFLVIAKEIAEPTKKDKTSIMFSVKDKVGALHDMLVPFKKNKVNLTKIESRPSKRKAWEYYFFVDLQGHVKDKNVARALKGLESQAAYFKILGSYPAAGKE